MPQAGRRPRRRRRGHPVPPRRCPIACGHERPGPELTVQGRTLELAGRRGSPCRGIVAVETDGDTDPAGRVRLRAMPRARCVGSRSAGGGSLRGSTTCPVPRWWRWTPSPMCCAPPGDGRRPGIACRTGCRSSCAGWRASPRAADQARRRLGGEPSAADRHRGMRPNAVECRPCRGWRDRPAGLGDPGRTPPLRRRRPQGGGAVAEVEFRGLVGRPPGHQGTSRPALPGRLHLLRRGDRRVTGRGPPHQRGVGGRESHRLGSAVGCPSPRIPSRRRRTADPWCWRSRRGRRPVRTSLNRSRIAASIGSTTISTPGGAGRMPGCSSRDRWHTVMRSPCCPSFRQPQVPGVYRVVNRPSPRAGAGSPPWCRCPGRRG